MKRPILEEGKLLSGQTVSEYIDALNSYIDHLEKEYHKVAKIPSLEEWLAFWQENGFDLEIGAQQYKAYVENGWKDSNNRPLKSWKLKCRQVWFKPQNKAKNNLTSKPSVLSENQRIFETVTKDVQ